MCMRNKDETISIYVPQINLEANYRKYQKKRKILKLQRVYYMH